MKVAVFLLCVSFMSSSLWAFPLTPNSDFTKGSLCTKTDPDYFEDRYAEQIPYCQRRVDSTEKARIYKLYDIPKSCWQRYTIDHFYPLAMGGSNHQDNLWPEHKLVKATRMNLELETYGRLKDGQITQKEALDLIRTQKLNPPTPESEAGSECDELDQKIIEKRQLLDSVSEFSL